MTAENVSVIILGWEQLGLEIHIETWNYVFCVRICLLVTSMTSFTLIRYFIRLFVLSKANGVFSVIFCGS